MAASTSSTRMSLQDVLDPNAAVNAATALWLRQNKRRSVKPLEMKGRVSDVMRFMDMPEWPGAGTTATVVDSLPLICVPGMPAKEYPSYVSPLTAYTLAELAATSPHIATQVWSPSMIHIATLTVATRAGVWAALNRTPVVAAGISSQALRWSATLGTVVVREAALGDGTELWRLSLASSPGIPALAVQACPALVGSAPAQFLMGGTLLLQSGEVYAMHYLERAITSYLRSVVPSDAVMYLRLDSRGTWDTLNAAAVGGFRASVIASLIKDRLFTLCANLRVAMDDAPGLRVQVERLTASASSVNWGFPSDVVLAGIAARAPAMDADEDDDAASVADTEAGGGMSQFQTPRAGSPVQRSGSDPPPLDPGVRADLLDAIRAVPRMTDDVRSVGRMADGSDSIRF